MKTHIQRCPTCGTYTMAQTCPGKECGASTRPAMPPRYSPQDKWGKYRRAMRKTEQ